MHFLPGYSPELNPDEILNADLKRTMSTGTAPKSKDELKQASAPSSTSSKSRLAEFAPTSANPRSATPPETTYLPSRSITSAHTDLLPVKEHVCVSQHDQQEHAAAC